MSHNTKLKKIKIPPFNPPPPYVLASQRGKFSHVGVKLTPSSGVIITLRSTAPLTLVNLSQKCGNLYSLKFTAFFWNQPNLIFLCMLLDSSPLPEDMLDTLIKSRYANTGVFNLRQVKLSWKIEVSNLFWPNLFFVFFLFFTWSLENTFCDASPSS